MTHVERLPADAARKHQFVHVGVFVNGDLFRLAADVLVPHADRERLRVGIEADHSRRQAHADAGGGLAPGDVLSPNRPGRDLAGQPVDLRLAGYIQHSIRRKAHSPAKHVAEGT